VDLGFVGWIIVGFLGGALSGMVVGGRTARGCLPNIVVGVLGAVIGGWAARELGFGTGQGLLAAIVLAVLGSAGAVGHHPRGAAQEPHLGARGFVGSHAQESRDVVAVRGEHEIEAGEVRRHELPRTVRAQIDAALLRVSDRALVRAALLRHRECGRLRRSGSIRNRLRTESRLQHRGAGRLGDR
jgi:uncharacterized membrane protein YeaQ/YmgE (transglycosylase-associated protein family)